jgi:hypothetical protein
VPKPHTKGEYTSEQKILDYHTSLKHILDELIQCQQSGGIRWDFKFKGRNYDVILQMPILLIIGDSEGHDKMCARTGSNNLKCKRLCRACDCTPEDADDPDYIYTYTVQDDAKRAYYDQDKDTLKNMSLFNIPNAWWCVDFGGCERGIYGAVPGEVLHFLQHGLHQYLKQSLLDQKMLSIEARKRKRKQSRLVPDRDSANIESQYNAADKDDKSTRNVFHKQNKEILEAYAAQIGSILQRQSDRNVPRTKFCYSCQAQPQAPV